jgi:hypothetical protein
MGHQTRATHGRDPPEAQVTLDLNNVTTVFINFLSGGFAHAENALQCPLDERVMVTTAGR